MATAKTNTETKTAPADVVSVTKLVPTMKKYILEISRSEDKNAVDPVFIGNGDYQVTLKRGVAVVVPEAIINVLKDAVTGVVDAHTMEVTEVPSYPYQAVPYAGSEPIGTVMDIRTNMPKVPKKPN